MLPPGKWVHHKRLTVVRIGNYAACGRIAGSVYIAAGISEQRTTTPTPASHRVRQVTVKTSGSRGTDMMKWGLGRRPLASTFSRRPKRSWVNPGRDWSGIPAPPGRSSHACLYPSSSLADTHSRLLGVCGCENSHFPSHQGIVVHWPWFGMRRRLIGQPSGSWHLVGPSRRQGRMAATKPGTYGCHSHLK